MSPIPCDKGRILIVDDEDAVRRIFKQVLVADLPGVMIDLATNGLEAIKLFHLGHHAVILMDLFMPVMNGEQAYRGITQLCERERWAMPAVVFCTAYSAAREIRNIVDSDPNHCMLQKPVKNDLLIETIRSRLTA